MGATWLYVSLALVGSALSVPIRQMPETLCEAEKNFLRIADEESCINYFQCYSGLAYHMQCPDYTWFNDEEQICDEGTPPRGCEPAQPPPTSPLEEPDRPEEPVEEPEESTEEPEEPIEETDDPIEEPEEPTEDQERPIEESEEPTEDQDMPIEETGEPVEQPEESVEEPQEPAETINPIQELVPPVDESEEPMESPFDEPPEPVNETEESNEDTVNPIDEQESSEEQAISEQEGSGDPVNQEQSTESTDELEQIDVGEGSGFGEFRQYLVRQFGRSEETESSTGGVFLPILEVSGDFPDAHGLDIELDELFIADMIPDDAVFFEKPTIDPVFALPEPEAKYK